MRLFKNFKFWELNFLFWEFKRFRIKNYQLRCCRSCWVLQFYIGYVSIKDNLKISKVIHLRILKWIFRTLNVFDKITKSNRHSNNNMNLSFSIRIYIWEYLDLYPHLSSDPFSSSRPQLIPNISVGVNPNYILGYQDNFEFNSHLVQIQFNSMWLYIIIKFDLYKEI